MVNQNTSTPSAFADFPADTRLWVYGADRELSERELAAIARALDEFVSNWHSHRVPVRGAYALADRRFILLAGYCTDGVSGCSTDSSVHAVKATGVDLGVNFLDSGLVFYRAEEGVASTTRVDFRDLVAAGEVDDQTRVFDLTLQTVGDLREKGLERPLSDSWHGRAFKPTA